jgi:hypothetical protein
MRLTFRVLSIVPLGIESRKRSSSSKWTKQPRTIVHKKAGLWIKHCWTEPSVEAGDFVTSSMGFVNKEVAIEDNGCLLFCLIMRKKAA